MSRFRTDATLSPRYFGLPMMLHRMGLKNVRAFNVKRTSLWENMELPPVGKQLFVVTRGRWFWQRFLAFDDAGVYGEGSNAAGAVNAYLGLKMREAFDVREAP
jgi:hypothetical protein